MLLTKARNDGYRLIYIDETCFTRKTVVDSEWMRPKENIAVDVAMLEEPTLALLCGISKEKGGRGTSQHCGVPDLPVSGFLKTGGIGDQANMVAGGDGIAHPAAASPLINTSLRSL